MRVSGFMNVQIVEQYSNLKREIVVSIALMERFLARRFSLVVVRVVAVRSVQTFGQEVCRHF
jgi:hypothetical protein